MRILHVTPTYLPAVRYGGPIYSVHGLCRALAGQGHEVHVFTTNVDGSRDSDVPLEQPVDLDGVHVWYFPSIFLRRLFFSPAMQRMLHQQMASFDLVHLHSVFLWPTWAAARVARRAGVAYVLSPRGMLVRELIRRKSWFFKTCWIQMIERKNLQKAAALHVTSNVEAEALTGFSFWMPPATVIANGVDLPQKWTRDELSEDVRVVTKMKRYVLYLGRINWKKGLDRLLCSWKDVPGQQLVIAGNDEENYQEVLQGIVQNEGIQDKVIFLSRSVTGADKEALFTGAGLFVLPSYAENFGITVLEAMVRGVPVLVTKDVGAAAIVQQSGAGMVTDGETLGRDIACLLASKSTLTDMARAGQVAAQAYTWQQVGREMAQFYQKVIHA